MTFRGASAEAFEATRRELETVVSGTADAAKVGGDLFSVVAILRSEPALRRVVTDMSLPAQAKSGLVREILGGKVDDGALSVVVTAVERRWTAARDLADALEQLGVDAVVRSAVSESERMADELFAVGQLVKEQPEPPGRAVRPGPQHRGQAGPGPRLLDGKALPATIRLVEQAVTGTHRTVGIALKEYQRVAAEVHGEGVATVRVAHPLSDVELRRLADSLARQYGRPVHLNVVSRPR